MKAFTIFGGTGDLTFRKLLPAFYNMAATKEAVFTHEIIIIGRRDYSSASYRQLARNWIKKFSRVPYDENIFENFALRIHYYKMNFIDKEAYRRLNTYYAEHNLTEHIFYFAVAPRFFSIIATGLLQVDNSNEAKVILEKPFGEDLASAKALNTQLEQTFTADNIFRIDHYLGKEMVRNIQTLRFCNPIFSNLWNSHYIESVQISAFEAIGIGNRGGYYDASGALQDMVQNHLLQILSIVAMEWPEQQTELFDAQIRVLKALRPIENIEESLVLGQYNGYREENLVAPHSRTETYAALRLFIDNERWWGTPFYIRTGKKLNKREIEIAITFRPAFLQKAPRNILIIKVQPTEGVYLQFNMKKPGDTDEIIQAKMDFSQDESHHRLNTPEAYERLLKACINNNHIWFTRWEQIEVSWQYINRMQEAYKKAGLPVYLYAPGSSGPEEANALLEQDGHSWLEVPGK